MTEVELLRLQVRGIPVHVHKAAKRGEWVCSSPYCHDLTAEQPQAAPGELEETAAIHDRGDLA